MNAARKKSRTPSFDRGDAGERHGPGWLTGIVIALLTARFLVPTEASVDGETLWLVQLWILAAAVWGWRQFLRGRPMLHWDLGTLAAGLLVAGHLISGFVLLSRGGDKRAAVNMMWEWVSLGITFVIVRSVLAESGARRTVIWALTCVGVSLAGLGLYQHFVEFPQIAKEYRSNRSEFDELQKSPNGGTPSQRYRRVTRLRELHRWLVERDIPLDGPARKQWEARALSSTEPFGTFALANTFAGLLVVFLFPVVAVVIAALRENGDWSIFRPSFPGSPQTVARKTDLSPFSWLIPACFALLLVACLVLTKSRTAWVGGIVGGLVWWWTGRTGHGQGRRWFGWVAVATAVIGAVAVGAALTGGLDREVLSESPKSLRYRWQYWTGTVGVLEELPLFGPGPGNFRQRYLKHKLPESSEEIRDPHNLFLDVWCSGGVIALAGLLLLFAWSGRRLLSRSSSSRPIESVPPFEDGSRVGLGGIAAGHLFVNFYIWFVNDGNLPRIWWLLSGSAAAWLLTRRAGRTATISTACLAGAGAALAVHLLGAGGIEMPAVTQMLLLLGAAMVPPRGDAAARDAAEADPAARFRLAAALFATAASAVLFGTCLSTATIPVLTRQSMSLLGRQQMREDRPREAERSLRKAAVNDPLSPAPARELAELAFHRWEKSPQSDAQLEQAIRLQKVAVGLDPYHFTGYWTLGRWYGMKYEIGRKPADLASSLGAFARGVELYPHYALLLADYARILKLAGQVDRAADMAGRSLEMDDLNHHEGHTDKFLPPENRQRLLDLLRTRKEPSAAGNRN
jgi:O-antigen ligase